MCWLWAFIVFGFFSPLPLGIESFICHPLLTQITLSQYLRCAFSFPSQFLRPQNVLDTSILEALAFPFAGFKCHIPQKLSLGGETKPCGGLTSRMCIWCRTSCLAHQTKIWGKCTPYLLNNPTLLYHSHLYRWLTKNMFSLYIVLELKEFLLKSPTSLLAWL